VQPVISIGMCCHAEQPPEATQGSLGPDCEVDTIDRSNPPAAPRQVFDVTVASVLCIHTAVTDMVLVTPWLQAIPPNQSVLTARLLQARSHRLPISLCCWSAHGCTCILPVAHGCACQPASNCTKHAMWAFIAGCTGTAADIYIESGALKLNPAAAGTCRKQRSPPPHLSLVQCEQPLLQSCPTLVCL
jgi:hypothetical protein